MTHLVRRVTPLVALGALLILVIRLQSAPEASADVWFHLRFGQEFITEWTLRNPGHLGVYDTAEWVPTQWLAQVGMAWTEEHFGIAGIIWANGVLVMLLAVLVYTACRLLASPLPSAITTFLAILAASTGLAARPQLFSYVLIVLTTAAWLKTARDGKPRYWLIGLAWVWPMLHGMWPVGISISAAVVLGLVLQNELPKRTLLKMAAIPVFSCTAAVLNPLGLDVVRALFGVRARSQYFTEWGPTDFTTPPGAILVILILTVLVSGLRSRDTPWVHTALALLALIWGLYSLRTGPVAALMLAPLAAAALQRLVPQAGFMTRPELLSIIAMLMVGTVAMGPVATHQAEEPVVPVWVDGRLDALPSGSRVLNDWDTGSYFLFEYDDLDYVMHGYGDVFTNTELDRNLSLIRLEPGWIDMVADLDADVALLDPSSPLGYALEESLEWTVIQQDSHFVLLKPLRQR